MHAAQPCRVSIPVWLIAVFLALTLTGFSFLIASTV
jgi:hypothetical protein